MRKGAKIALGIVGGFALLCGGGIWWSAKAMGFDPGMYDRAIALGMPLEPEMLVTDPAPPEPDNAAFVIEEMIAAMNTAGINWGEVRSLAIGSAADKKEARARLKKAEPILIYAHQAAAKPACRFERDWAQGADLLLPEYAPVKSACGLLAARAILSSQEGQMKSALADLEAGFRMAEFSGTDPGLISMLVRIACHRIMLEAASRMAVAAKSESELAQIRQMVEKSRSEIQLFFYVRAELTIAAAAARNITSTAQLSSLTTGHSSPPASIIRSGPPRNAVMRAQLNKYLRHWVPIFEMGEDVHDNAKLGARLSEMGRKVDENPDRTDMLTAILMPVFSQSVTTITRLDAHHACTLAYIDILAYKARTGSLPNSVKDLPEIHTDPFNSQPLRYRKEGKGFRIYSVGQDGIDQKGRSSSELNIKNAGDDGLVYPPQPKKN